MGGWPVLPAALLPPEAHASRPLVPDVLALIPVSYSHTLTHKYAHTHDTHTSSTHQKYLEAGAKDKREMYKQERTARRGRR